MDPDSSTTESKEITGGVSAGTTAVTGLDQGLDRRSAAAMNRPGWAGDNLQVWFNNQKSCSSGYQKGCANQNFPPTSFADWVRSSGDENTEEALVASDNNTSG
jgi:hypothetical protein